MTTEPTASSACQHGGTKVLAGVDANGDKVLQSGEVQGTAYVCNGAPGPRGDVGAPGADGASGANGAPGTDGTDGHNSVTKTTRFEAGEDAGCANGGVRIQSGVDLNDNGVLDSNERDSTAYVCDIASETSDLCAASPCQNGGVCMGGTSGFTCACPAQFGGTVCQEQGYILRGTVSNLNGRGLTLAAPGQPNLTVPAGARSFVFPNGVAAGTSYSVTVAAQPYSRAETCTVRHGVGVVGHGDVMDIEVTCAPTGCVSAPCPPQPLEVLTVPWETRDGEIGHPAYNGHWTTFKAIARGGNGTYQVEWDFDGDGNFDQTMNVTNRYDLSARFLLPPQEGDRRFVAIVRVTSGGVSATARYPVQVFADVPLDPGSANVAQQQVMRDVAVDDGLWFLHNRMVRTGDEFDPLTGGKLSASFAQSQSSWNVSNALSGLFLEGLARNGHQVAFPPAYLGDMPNASQNARHWALDPYAEDMARLVNGLTAQAFPVVVAAADEDNRTGVWPETTQAPILGSDDGIGIFVGKSVGDQFVGVHANVLRGLASAQLAGYVAQTGDSNRVAGRRFEFIIQQMVDALVWAQNDEPQIAGSWYYFPNTSQDLLGEFDAGAIDAAEALWQAEHAMSSSGVIVPNLVKARLAQYIRSNANNCPLGGTGGSWNNGGENVCDFSTSAAHLFALGWFGSNTFAPSDTRLSFPSYHAITRGQLRTQFDSTLTFISNAFLLTSAGGVSWDMGFVEGGDFGRTDGRGNIWGMVHWTRAARVVQPQLVSFGLNHHVQLFTRYLVGNQQADGSWKSEFASGLNNNHDYNIGTDVRSAWAIITLSSDRSVVLPAIN